MKQVLYDILSNNGNLSSSRIINFIGMIVGTIIILYHTIWLGTLNYDIYGIYLMYAAGTYGLNRITSKKTTESETENVNINPDYPR